jgi:hypothetical protein
MIQVTIRAPSPRTGRTEIPAILNITNDGTGNEAYGNYDLLLIEEERMVPGRIEAWPRDRPILELVARAMKIVAEARKD